MSKRSSQHFVNQNLVTSKSLNHVNHKKKIVDSCGTNDSIGDSGSEEVISKSTQRIPSSNNLIKQESIDSSESTEIISKKTMKPIIRPKRRDTKPHSKETDVFPEVRASNDKLHKTPSTKTVTTSIKKNTTKSKKSEEPIKQHDKQKDDKHKPPKQPKEGLKKETRKKKIKEEKIAVIQTLPIKKENEKKGDTEKVKINYDDLLQEDSKQRWVTLKHNGVYFTPPYKQHQIGIRYDNKLLKLDSIEEEYLTAFARFIDTPHYQKVQFKQNFMKDFIELMKEKNTTNKNIIKDINKIDFTLLTNYLSQLNEQKKIKTASERLQEKQKKEELKTSYGIAEVNGIPQPIGNFIIEPPGIFLGRGNHPKTGKIKPRIFPEDVIINCSEDAIPSPPPGHEWGGVIHNNKIMWLACWTVNGKKKYVQFDAKCFVRCKNDIKKYEKARKLKKIITVIRSNYWEDITSSDPSRRQRGLAIYLIDKLALRVGNEKKSDEADTVGTCSLRVEHVKLEKKNHVKFDFLGKDSMRYINDVVIDKRAFKVFKECVSKKGKSDSIFNLLSTNKLNTYLKSQMDGLTAKVFRTYNASECLQNELLKTPKNLFGDKANDAEKIAFYNAANREVAVLCNHQKSVKEEEFNIQIGRIKSKMLSIKKLHEKYKEYAIEFDEKEGKKVKDITIDFDLNDSDVNDFNKDNDKKTIEKLRIKELVKQKELMNGEIKDEIIDNEHDNSKKKNVLDSTPKPKSLQTCLNKLVKFQEQINKLTIELDDKTESKNYALGTSKLNYLDPRITTAWCKKVGLGVERIFSKSIREKFDWAMDMNEDYVF
ncbi:DNA topoisomerase I [Entamoeba marina]